MPLGDRDDQAEVRPDDLVLDRQGLLLEALDLVQLGRLRLARVELAAQRVRLELEVVHLAEEVGLLLPREQRHLVEARQVGGQALRRLRPARGLAVGRLGERGDDLGLVGPVFEARVRHELELRLQETIRPNLVDDPVDARPGPAEALGQDVDGDPPPIELVHLGLGVLVQGAGGRREDRPVRVLAVVGLEGHANRLRATFHLSGDPLGDLRQAALSADAGHPASPADDLVPLLVRQLAEPAAPVHLILVFGDEPPQARFQEPDLGAAVDDEPPGDQPLAPPAGHRPGRDVEPAAHRVHRQDRLARLLDLLADRPGQVLDEEAKIVPDVPAVQNQGRRPLGPIAGDPEDEVLIRIALSVLHLAQQTLGAVDLLQAAWSLQARNGPAAVSFNCFARRMSISAAHPASPSSATLRGTIARY